MAALAKSALHPRIANSLQHFDFLHSEQSATVLLWDKNATSRAWTKIEPNADESKLLELQNGLPERFISVNQFYGWRLITLLAELRACYVDLDGCDDVGTAMETVHKAGIPLPSAVISTGRGLHLYWLHEPMKRSALADWQLIQNQLCETLKPLGADPKAKDCTRVLRLAGSIHSKSGNTVNGFIRDPAPWKFQELFDAVVPLEKKASKKPPKASVRDINSVRAERSQRTLGRSIYARWQLVLDDLLKIAEWYGGSIPEGYRNIWLHLCATALTWFANAETIEHELEHYARRFTPDISENELADVLMQPLKRVAEVKALQETGELHFETDPRYRYKRTTLYERLEGLITPELEQCLRAIVRDETKAQREKERQAGRDRQAEGRHKRSHKESITKAKPWEALGISRATFYRRKKSES